MENIMSLATIGGTQPSRIHDFYENLLFNVQSLETMKKLQRGEWILADDYLQATRDKRGFCANRRFLEVSG